MERTVFDVAAMPCPSGERMMRMVLGRSDVDGLTFESAARRLTVYHRTTPERLVAFLSPLKFTARVVESSAVSVSALSTPSPTKIKAIWRRLTAFGERRRLFVAPP